LHTAQASQAKYYNRNTKDQDFHAGDELLVLLLSDLNKLLLQWKGTFKEEEEEEMTKLLHEYTILELRLNPL